MQATAKGLTPLRQVSAGPGMEPGVPPGPDAEAESRQHAPLVGSKGDGAEHERSLTAYVSRLAGAQTVEELADRCLAGLASVLDSSAATFDLVDLAAERGAAVATLGVSDYFVTIYERYGRHQDPVLRSALQTGRATDNRALMSPARFCSLPIYTDVFRLHLLTNVMYAPIAANGEVVATLGIGRGDDRGPFTEHELALAQSLAGLLGNFLALLWERERMARELDQLGAALDLCDEPMVVTDAWAGTRRLNVAAKRLLSRVASGAPSLDDLIQRTGERDRALVRETAVRLRQGGEAVLRCRSAQLNGGSGALVSFLELAAGSAGALPATIEAALTPRERDIARLAALGLRDPEIAEQLALSPHTVKHHLKSIYRKLGVRSRTALARLAN